MPEQEYEAKLAMLRAAIQEGIDSGVAEGDPVERVLAPLRERLQNREAAEDRLEALIQEAEDSGPATEMTSEDWIGIEKEGLQRIHAPKSREKFSGPG